MYRLSRPYLLTSMERYLRSKHPLVTGISTRLMERKLAELLRGPRWLKHQLDMGREVVGPVLYPLSGDPGCHKPYECKEKCAV